jgi:hypothetical protein
MEDKDILRRLAALEAQCLEQQTRMTLLEKQASWVKGAGIAVSALVGGVLYLWAQLKDRLSYH